MKNTILVHFFVLLFGVLAGYVMALNSVVEESPYPTAQQFPETAFTVSPAVESMANASDFSQEYGRSSARFAQPCPDAGACMPATPGVDRPAPPRAADPSVVTGHQGDAAQENSDARVELIQENPAAENLDTLLRLLREDPDPDVRRTVIERLSSAGPVENAYLSSTLDTVFQNEPDAGVLRAALDYYHKQFGDQYAFNAWFMLTQRDDLSVFALGQAYSFAVDAQLLAAGDAAYYITQSPSFAKLGAEDREYLTQDVLSESGMAKDVDTELN